MSITFQGETKFVDTEVGQIETRFAISSGWEDYDFAQHASIDAPVDRNEITFSLAINGDHPGFGHAFHSARKVNNSDALENELGLLEKALLEHTSIPEDIHRSVISRMGRLALAKATKSADVFHPVFLPRFLQVARRYDCVTLQNKTSMHKYIINRSLEVDVPYLS